LNVPTITESSVGIIDGYPKIQNFVFIRQSYEETYYNGLLLIKL